MAKLTLAQRAQCSRRHATWGWNRKECDVHWVDDKEEFGIPPGPYLRPRAEHRREAWIEHAQLMNA